MIGIRGGVKVKIKLIESDKKRKTVIFSILIMTALLACSLSILHKDYIKPLEIARERITTTAIGTYATPLKQNEKIIFTTKPNAKKISGISLAFNNDNGKSDTVVCVVLRNISQNTVLGEWTSKLSECFNGTYTYFNMEQEKALERTDKLEISIEVLEENNGNGGVYGRGINEEEGYAYEILGGDYKVAETIFVSLVIALGILVAILAAMLLIEYPLEIKFALITLWIGIIYSILIPQYVVPDEPAHFLKTYAASSRLLGEKDIDEEERIILRKEDYSFIIHEKTPRRESYKNYIKGIIGKSDTNEKTIISVGKEIDAPDIVYAPQIMGITIARILHLNGEQLFLLGRLFALFFYVMCGYLAIKIMPFAKEMIFVVGLLPMSMQQAVSFSYDSTINSVSFLLIAYFIYLIYEKEKIEKKDVIIVTILTCIVSPVKIVYIVIIGLGILIPKEKFKTNVEKWISAGIIGVFGIVSIVITRLAMMNKIVTSNGNLLPWIEEEAYGLNGVLANPMETARIFFRTFEREGSRLLDTMIGSQMGWLEIKIPSIIITGFIILLLISVFKRENEESISVGSKLWIAILGSSGILAVCLSMLLTWTRKSAVRIEGVQGRYFLPYLPMLLMTARNQYIVIRKSITSQVIFVTVFLQISTILTIFIFAMSR